MSADMSRKSRAAHCRKLELKRPAGLLNHDALLLSVDDVDASDDDDEEEEDAKAPNANGSRRWWERKGWFPVLQVFREHQYFSWDRDGAFVLIRDHCRSQVSQLYVFSWAAPTTPRDHHVDCEAMVVSFSEHSACSSLDGLSQHAKWRGSCAQLLELASQRRDLAFPRRRLDPDDRDFQMWDELWAAVDAWAASGCPRWRGRWQVGRTRGKLWQPHKVPEACQVIAEHAAASRIQAAFRAWRWRRHVLWNPHTRVGAARLCRMAHAWATAD